MRVAKILRGLILLGLLAAFVGCARKQVVVPGYFADDVAWFPVDVAMISGGSLESVRVKSQLLSKNDDACLRELAAQTRRGYVVSLPGQAPEPPPKVTVLYGAFRKEAVSSCASELQAKKAVLVWMSPHIMVAGESAEVVREFMDPQAALSGRHDWSQWARIFAPVADEWLVVGRTLASEILGLDCDLLVANVSGTNRINVSLTLRFAGESQTAEAHQRIVTMSPIAWLPRQPTITVQPNSLAIDFSLTTEERKVAAQKFEPWLSRFRKQGNLRLTFSSTLGRDQDLRRLDFFLRDRIHQLPGNHVSLWIKDRVTVEIAAAAAHLRKQVIELVTKPLRVELKLVIHDDPYMRRIVQHATRDPNARELDIQLEFGRERPTEVFLRADDGERWVTEAHAQRICPAAKRGRRGRRRCQVSGQRMLELYLASLPAHLAPPKGHSIGVARRRMPGSTATSWRTYYLQAEPALTGRHVVSARAKRHPQTLRTIIVVSLTEEGKQRVEASWVGRQMAVLMDGNVQSAHVVDGPITKGRLNLIVSGYSAPASEESRTVSQILSAGSPIPLELDAVQEIGPEPLD